MPIKENYVSISDLEYQFKTKQKSKILLLKLGEILSVKILIV
jgi:hypothetical protein